MAMSLSWRMMSHVRVRLEAALWLIEGHYTVKGLTAGRKHICSNHSKAHNEDAVIKPIYSNACG